MGKLLKDETLYNNLRQATQNLNQLLADVNAGKGAIGMMAKDPQFAAETERHGHPAQLNPRRASTRAKAPSASS